MNPLRKATRLFVFISVVAVVATTHPASGEGTKHRLRGPHEYHESGRRVPRFFEIHGRFYTSIDALKQAVSHLPAHSRLRWTPDCMPYREIQLGPEPSSA